MAGLDVSIQSVRELRVKAKSFHDEIAKLHTDLAKENQAKTERIVREHDELGWMPDEKGRGRIDHLGSAKRMQFRDAGGANPMNAGRPRPAGPRGRAAERGERTVYREVLLLGYRSSRLTIRLPLAS